MITKDDVLKVIVDCRKPNGHTDYSDVCDKLKIDDVSLIPFLKELDESGYVMQTCESMTVTPLGLSAYEDLTPKAKFKKSFYKFSKLTLQRFVDIFIGVVIGVVIAYIAYHFGW